MEQQVDNDALCAMDQLTRALAIVEEKAPALFDQLPPGHIWRRKLEHVVVRGDMLEPVLGSFRERMCPENFGLLCLIYRSHDLGRVFDGLKRLGTLPDGTPEFTTHAEASVRILRSWGVFDCFSSGVGDLIAYAIWHHVDSWTPDAPETPDRMAQYRYVCTALLRDLDKLESFLSTTALYLHDAVKRRKEMQTHGFAECHRIQPGRFVDTFAAGNVPDLQQAIADAKRSGGFVSYEAYMLYFTSWIYDVNLSLVLERIVESGALRLLLGYFLRQLDRETYFRIESALQSFLQRHGMNLDA